MVLPKNNLVAIAYKTGYCGTLIYALTAMSPEVEQFKSFDQLSFDDGSAHEAKEHWFNNLHDYSDSLTVSKDLWDSYVPERTREALLRDKLIVFRCHPNIAYKLSFIENLRVLYLTHKNKYIPERWAYEKVYKPAGDEFFQQDLKRLLGTQKSIEITNQLKRKQLIRNLNHDVISWEELQNQMKTTPYKLEIDQILEKNFNSYLSLCEYLKITPVEQDQFSQIIDTYNSKQWKRF